MNEDVLKRAAEMLNSIKKQDKGSREQLEKDRRDLVLGVGQQITDTLKPMLKELVAQGKMTRNDLQEAVSKITVETNTPNVYVPEIKVPEPKVTVNVPAIKVPDVIMPDEMNVRGWVSLMGVSLETPLPVQLRDAKGNPLNLFENLTQVMSGGGGGKADFLTIKGFSASAFAEVTNPDGRVKVELPTGASGLTDTELRASSVPVAQASGAIWSTNVTNTDLDIRDLANATDSVSAYQVSGAMWSTSVIDIFGSTAAANVFNADNRIKVSVETGGSGLTDAELRATAVPVSQVSGASWSTEATQSGTWNIGTVTTVTGVTNSVAAAITDSTGVQYSGSNPLPFTMVSSSLATTAAVGPTPADTADDGNAPLQTGGIARQANPTAVAANDVVKSTYDDIGRQIIRPVQVRDLTTTAYVQITNGTETTLKATGGSGVYHDLIYVMGANNSDAAVSVDLRATTGGGVVMTLQVPASGTAGIACPVPLPAGDVDATWTADMSDITGTTVSLTALFSKEV